VEENLRFFAALYQTDEGFVQKTLQDFGLEDVKKQRAKTLSGGYMRRLSIAAALVSHPKILFLDEPTLGLDVLARRELWHVIASLKGKITIVLTSHYLEEIEHLCDRVAVLKQGNLVAEGTVEELKKQTNSNTFEDAFVALVEADNSTIGEGQV
jgi:ABC-2 type transport system ATP-binding protein